MRIARNLIPLTVLMTMGLGIACKKPAPAPETKQEEAPAPAPAPTPQAAPTPAPAPEPLKADEAAMMRQAADAALKDINFDLDKSDIREVDKPKLQAIADFMRSYPRAKVQIAGNCDERGTVEYNLALGERRAHAAQAYLVSLGTDGAKLPTISYGKERPKVQGHDEESWLINRNCEFTLQ
jgi:peptidoglycan-associated lipoprotein